MERLTEHHFIETKGSYMRCSDNCEMENCGECEKLDDLIDRLAAYEDTGLTPEEIEELIKRVTPVKPYVESGAERAL